MVSDKTSEFLKNSEVWLHNVGWTVEKFVAEEKKGGKKTSPPKGKVVSKMSAPAKKTKPAAKKPASKVKPARKKKI